MGRTSTYIHAKFHISRRSSYVYITETDATLRQIIHRLKSAVFWGIMRRRVVIVYRRFGTTYRSHPRGSRFRVGKKAYNVYSGKYGRVAISVMWWQLRTAQMSSTSLRKLEIKVIHELSYRITYFCWVFRHNILLPKYSATNTTVLPPKELKWPPLWYL
jgi:hypothetical protein